MLIAKLSSCELFEPDLLTILYLKHFIFVCQEHKFRWTLCPEEIERMWWSSRLHSSYCPGSHWEEWHWQQIRGKLCVCPSEPQLRLPRGRRPQLYTEKGGHDETSWEQRRWGEKTAKHCNKTNPNATSYVAVLSAPNQASKYCFHC